MKPYSTRTSTPTKPATSAVKPTSTAVKPSASANPDEWRTLLEEHFDSLLPDSDPDGDFISLTFGPEAGQLTVEKTCTDVDDASDEGVRWDTINLLGWLGWSLDTQTRGMEVYFELDPASHNANSQTAKMIAAVGVGTNWAATPTGTLRSIWLGVNIAATDRMGVVTTYNTSAITAGTTATTGVGAHGVWLPVRDTTNLTLGMGQMRIMTADRIAYHGGSSASWAGSTAELYEPSDPFRGSLLIGNDATYAGTGTISFRLYGRVFALPTVVAPWISSAGWTKVTPAMTRDGDYLPDSDPSGAFASIDVLTDPTQWRVTLDDAVEKDQNSEFVTFALSVPGFTTHAELHANDSLVMLAVRSSTTTTSEFLGGFGVYDRSVDAVGSYAYNQGMVHIGPVGASPGGSEVGLFNGTNIPLNANDYGNINTILHGYFSAGKQPGTILQSSFNSAGEVYDHARDSYYNTANTPTERGLRAVFGNDIAGSQGDIEVKTDLWIHRWPYSTGWNDAAHYPR